MLAKVFWPSSGAQALEHGSAWLNTAWTAKGNKSQIALASKQFLKMLVSLAMAALAFLGARGNYRNLVKMARVRPRDRRARAGAGDGRPVVLRARTRVRRGRARWPATERLRQHLAQDRGDADVHVGRDPCGGVLTTEELRVRDEIVFRELSALGIPVAWDLAGGYQKEPDGGIPKVLEIHMNTALAALAVT